MLAILDLCKYIFSMNTLFPFEKLSLHNTEFDDIFPEIREEIVFHLRSLALS